MCTNRGKSLADMLQMMNGFKPGMLEGKYVIVCTRPGQEWKVGQFTTYDLAPVHYLGGYVFTSVEAAQQAVEDLKAAGLKPGSSEEGTSGSAGMRPRPTGRQLPNTVTRC